MWLRSARSRVGISALRTFFGRGERGEGGSGLTFRKGSALPADVTLAFDGIIAAQWRRNEQVFGGDQRFYC